MFLRTVLLIRLVWVTIGLHVHAGDLARGTTGNLLDTKTEEFLAELSHLVEKVHLGLVLEILGANLGLIRVSTHCSLMYRSASISHYRHMALEKLPWHGSGMLCASFACVHTMTTTLVE